MNITLRKIDENNWRECIKLSVKEDQKEFVATNENGLALAYAHKETNPLLIYSDGTPVGFIMYGCDPDDGLYYINRFMIDKNHQGNGYGREALRILLNNLHSDGVESVDIIHKPDNYAAIRLYKSFGFELTEHTLGDDVISNLKLK